MVFRVLFPRTQIPRPFFDLPVRKEKVRFFFFFFVFEVPSALVSLLSPGGVRSAREVDQDEGGEEAAQIVWQRKANSNVGRGETIDEERTTSSSSSRLLASSV